MTAPSLRIGFCSSLIWASPYEMFASMPGSALHLIWREAGPVRSEHGFMLLATVGFAECPVLDLLRPSNRQANQK